MIHFVLEGSSKETPSGQRERASFEIEVVHLDTETTANGTMHTGKAQASFLLVLASAGKSKNRVAKKQGHMNPPIDRFAKKLHGGRAFFHLTEIDQRDLKGDADLGGCESNALEFAHGIFQNEGKFGQLFIGGRYWGGGLAEDGVPIQADGQNGYG